MNNEDKTIEELILAGGLEAAGVDQETGELLYSFTPKIEKLMPELYKEHINKINAGVMELWEMGFIDIDFFSSDPLITLTEKAVNVENVDKLSKSQRWNLLELIRLLYYKN